ncbi:DUF4268 domain-containing protein [Mailhella massiliensis]|uniref:DUF4268 domain-containing protein n=1 Tax=Mailhella massiliensis TaxID=1903261 RepID=UPI00194EBAA6
MRAGVHTRISAEESPFLHAAASRRNYPGCDAGVPIFCVANQNETRIALYLGAEKDRNKAVFDLLYPHGADIKKSIGHALQWKRNSDLMHSNVMYALEEAASTMKSTGSVWRNFMLRRAAASTMRSCPSLQEVAG